MLERLKQYILTTLERGCDLAIEAQFSDRAMVLAALDVDYAHRGKDGVTRAVTKQAVRDHVLACTTSYGDAMTAIKSLSDDTILRQCAPDGRATGFAPAKCRVVMGAADDASINDVMIAYVRRFLPILTDDQALLVASELQSDTLIS